MFDFHEKRKIRNILYSWPVIFFLVFCTIVLSVSVYHRYTVAHDMSIKLLEREQELESLKQHASALDAKVQYLKNERGIEEELRNRFDVAREGEQVIILVDGEEKRNREDVPVPLAPEEDVPWYIFWR